MRRNEMLRLLLLLTLSTPLIAETYIDIHGISKHSAGEHSFNEKNIGIGVTVDNVSFGTYKNSYYKNTVYATYNHLFGSIGDAELGGSIGLATGYTRSLFVAFPTVRYKWLKAGFIPAIGKGTSSVVFATITLKVSK